MSTDRHSAVECRQDIRICSSAISEAVEGHREADERDASILPALAGIVVLAVRDAAAVLPDAAQRWGVGAAAPRG